MAGFKWIADASFIRTFTGGEPLTVSQDVATLRNPRQYALRQSNPQSKSTAAPM